jgi:pyoverdine/dityrosine biosynthesis protein Dit1
MSKPNFQTMSQKELHRYVLDHREDQDAFYAYVDKLHEEGNWIEMPAVDSVQDLEKYPEFTSRFRTEFEPPDQAV